MSSTEQATPVHVYATRLVGQVKWFNNKAGYGFITIRDGEYADKDIFAHYSELRVTTSQYKYLMEGEYVEFDLVKTEGSKHEYQATDISGIKGGGLMCETRNANRQAMVRDSEPRAENTRQDNGQRRYRVKEETESRPSKPRTDVKRRAPPPRERKNPTPVSQSE
jgi:Y-box-binding protein 1